METFDLLVLSFQSSLCRRKIFSKKKNMEAIEVKLEDILSCEEIPIVRLKSCAINAFVMVYHVYKKNWTPSIGEVKTVCKDSFLFLKSDKNHHCKITVTKEATNAVVGLEMKVPCQFFLAEEKFIIVLQEKLSKLL